MALERLLRRIAIPQIPQQDHRILIPARARHKLGTIIRIPRNRTDRLPAQVIQRETLLLRSCVPDGREAARGAGDEDVRHLLVPVEGVEVVGAGYCGAEAEGLAGVGEVVEVEFTF